jgi:hypothetical protein
VLNASGGLRTTAAFAASTLNEYNPWGVAGTFGELKLGNLLTLDTSSVAFSAPSWPGSPTVPGIEQVASQLSIIAAVDHAPGMARAGDHPDDSERMGTGYYGLAAPGLLTALTRVFGADAPAPIASLGGGPFDIALGDWVANAPVALTWYGLPNVPPTGGDPIVGRPLEDVLDARLRERRGSLARGQVDAYLSTKGALRKYGPVLAEKSLHLYEAPSLDEALDGITNRMLLEAVGHPNIDAPTSQPDAILVAMGLRLLQMGSPAINVSIGGFDLHSEEDVEAPDNYGRFARYLAGIHFALSNMNDEDGPMIDSTLVVTTSEFGRSPGDAATGFNDGNGSDHGDGASWRNQAHVVFGAGITPRTIAPVNDGNEAVAGEPVSTHCLLATLCTAIGVPAEEVDALWAPGTDLYPEGLPLGELFE